MESKIGPKIQLHQNSRQQNTNLKLWNGHLKRPLANLSGGLDELQQYSYVRRVERPTGVRAHCRPQLPLHVHQLERIKSHQLIGFTGNI